MFDPKDLPNDALVRQSVNLSIYTSWLVGGLADFFAEPATIEEFKRVLVWASDRQIATTFLGGGTNVLISDRGIRGLVLSTRKLKSLESRETDGRFEITAAAGVGKQEVLKLLLKKKLAPAIFLAGIPGNVGGGVVMNAGVSENLNPREFHEIVDWVEVLRFPGDLQIVRFSGRELGWSYRHSFGWQPGIITSVGLSWPLEVDDSIPERVRTANRIRLAKQPLDLPSCGSVFVNPPQDKAGRLIETAGLKGFHIGAAEVSTKHANFIVNKGGATASNIRDVIEAVRDKVRVMSGVELKTEVVTLGEW